NRESRALFQALQRGRDAQEIRQLITPQTASIPDNFYGLKPLFWALSYGASAEVLSLLLAAHPEAATEKHPLEGWTPLHYAERLSADSVRLLIDRCPGAARERDADGTLPLHWAAEHNAPVEIVRQLLEANREAASQRDDCGRLPVKLAIDNECSQELLALLCVASPEAFAVLPPTPPTSPSAPSLIALIFPGQGSQYVGMLEDVKVLPAVRDMLQQAEAILGYDLLKFCSDGPESSLQDINICLPVIYIAGLAAREKLHAEQPEAVEKMQASAGLFVGEYAALVAAGVFSFADGLWLVKELAEAAQEALKACPQASVSVAGLEEVQVRDLCRQAREKHGADEVCQITGFLFKKGFAVGGTRKSVEEFLGLAVSSK
ncbi:unnamed protein product, partial [Polarella glacialis]